MKHKFEIAARTFYSRECEWMLAVAHYRGTFASIFRPNDFLFPFDSQFLPVLLPFNHFSYQSDASFYGMGLFFNSTICRITFDSRD